MRSAVQLLCQCDELGLSLVVRGAELVVLAGPSHGGDVPVALVARLRRQKAVLIACLTGQGPVERLCGDCRHWSALSRVDGSCQRGFAAHGISHYSVATPYPITSVHSRCWVNQGRGWQSQ